MRTKAYHAFEQKLNYFNDDLEFIDILNESVMKGDLTEESSEKIFKRLNPTKHTHLARRQNSIGSRKLVITHLKATLYSAYIKDLYEEVTQYLRTILYKASLNGFPPGRIIGEHNAKVDLKELLEKGCWASVSQYITDLVFQSLEAEKSTIQLLTKISKKLNLTIDLNLINKALPYLEIRHLLVHTDGKASTEFQQKYPNIRLSKHYVVLDFQLINELRIAVKDLILAYDKEIIKENLLKAEDTQP